ncbi:hypothetical protein BDZ97DRAFT_1838693 [Flammula alnicola]|nr:hypothetical protein BDZ97DRAFT_1838693 [Flammula alnicola]
MDPSILSTPQHCQPQVTVPPGWFVTIAAVSREAYNQVVTITDDSLSKQLTKVAAPNNLCNSINVHEVVKPDTAPATVPDYVTLMIFIEDGKTKASADHDVYDNAVATIHLVKRTPKQGAQPHDDDDDDDDD